jgi:23S rRNA (uracil1939-C5)-methyltransferase
VPEATISIDSIAAGGDGVGRHGSLVVFVPRSAPGDQGVVTYEPHGNFARGSWRSLEQPSPLRVEPQCVHYTRDRCGGCQLQHLKYSEQLAAKRANVVDALQRIAKRQAPPVSMHPSPAQWRYRRKLTLEVRREGERIRAGLHPYDEPAKIFSLNDCEITTSEVMGA